MASTSTVGFTLLLCTTTAAVGQIDLAGCLGRESHAVYVPHAGVAIVGEIPVGRAGISIELVSAADVDLQLVDLIDGTEIVAWPDGVLHGAEYECADHAGVEYCYSGYNGIDGEHGHERIDVMGVTNRPLLVQVYGYAAGAAEVTITWDPLVPCSGAFFVQVPYQQTVSLGAVPICLDDVHLEIESDVDVDLRLTDDTDGTVIVGWPDGLLAGPTFDCVEHAGVEYCSSGYNGIDGEPGHELIEINGTTNHALTVSAFGYASGAAVVTWSGAPTAGCPDPADLDGDGQVGFPDLLVVLSAWGPCAPADPCAPDLDGNDAVGFPDLLIVLSSWSV